MVYDLLNIDQNVYQYEQSVPKPMGEPLKMGESNQMVVPKRSILNDYDDLFRRYKLLM